MITQKKEARRPLIEKTSYGCKKVAAQVQI